MNYFQILNPEILEKKKKRLRGYTFFQFLLWFTIIHVVEMGTIGIASLIIRPTTVVGFLE